LNKESDDEVLTGTKFHSLEARKEKVRLPELVLALRSFRFLVDLRVLMLCTFSFSFDSALIQFQRSGDQEIHLKKVTVQADTQDFVV